mgnify:CR=1 FL=1
MNIISVTDITKTYTERKLFEKASFYLQEREKVGVIGINGTGKSTLLKIAAGIEEPDEGQVIRANHIVVRYLPQNPVFDPELSVIDTVLAQSSQNFVGGTSEQNQNAGNHAEHVEHWNLESDAKAMMTKLGITNFEQKAGELSGGQRKRLALVAALLVPCDVLILDEPTNHLDSAMADWLEDFLKKAEEKGKEENDLLLLYSVICYENDATEITGDDLATLLDAAKENTQESVVYFLKKILDDRIHHWNLQGYVDKFLLASKILVLKMDSISSLAQEDVCECADFFMDLMEVSYALKHISEQFSLSIKENMGAASDIILVFSDLYKEPVKKSYEKKLLEAGFSNMDILNLNMGIWYVYERTTELYVSSEIKWWRLAKRWFQSLFLQDKEVPFDGNRLMNLFDKKMPRKIDGEDLAPKFLLAGFAHGIPCVNNSYLLFYILTMYGSYRHSSERVNQLSLWESICTNHPFRIDSEDELEWMRGLLGYEWNSRDKYFMQRIYVLLLRKYVNEQKRLEEKESILKEMFGYEVKEIIYKNMVMFSREAMDKLFESGYLSFDDFVKKGSRGSIEKYLSSLNKRYILIWLSDFCKKNNCIFNDTWITYFKESFNNSWMISFAYGKVNHADAEEILSSYTAEEQGLLLGLVCEICARIPGICDLDDLMAGFISNPMIRSIIGEDLSEQWHQELLKRNYRWIDAVQKDYLPAEEYNAWILEKEQKKKQEKIERVHAAINELKEDTLAELGDITSNDKFLVAILEKAKYCADNTELKAYIGLIYEHCPGKVFLNKDDVLLALYFIKGCYSAGVVTYLELVNFIKNIREKTNE